MSRPAQGELVQDDNGVRVSGQAYTWSWSAGEDLLAIDDPSGRRILTAPMQPAVVIRTGSGEPRWSPGVLDAVVAGDQRVELTYRGVNGADTVTVSWRFEPTHCWIEPVVYTATAESDVVVSLHYFARRSADGPEVADPGLHCRYLIHPGVSGSDVVSPVIQTQAKLDTTTWLGRGGGGVVEQRQQWGLPVHYVAGLNSTVHPVEVGSLTTKLSDAFCLGLADLPAGDLLLRHRAERISPVVQLRGDLWGHLRGPGRFDLGATMVLTFGADYPSAIRAYQGVLVDAGIVPLATSSPEKAARTTAAEFNTWGAQLAAGKASQRFDQEGLEAIHAQLLASGLAAAMFVVDDKWEGEYGKLEHGADRFPAFEKTLGDIRDGGLRVGMWAAFLRCDDPASHGLTSDDLLRSPAGIPVVLGPADAPYFLFDPTRPQVQDMLRERIAEFVRRYRPVLVKFDFGYEIPDLSRCAPWNLDFAGERLLRLALDVVVGALREADPDIVIMYYALSPLFAPYFDVHSLDDPWMNAQEYHVEANRRLFFSRFLGELGMPSYGSGGYDWVNQIDIWFDSVAFGPLGMLSSFTGDLSDSSCTPAHVAAFNGLTRLSRPVTRFRVDAIGASGLGPVTGARSSSWVRFEDDEPVLAVLRVHDFVGAPGVREYADLVTTQVDVAVGSLDAGAGGLRAARRIGVVTRGAGEVVLPFLAGAPPVNVVVHTLDGRRHETSVAVDRTGGLRLQLAESVDGSLVTWVELVRT